MTCNPVLPACVSGMLFSRVKFAPPSAGFHFWKFCLRATARENHAVAGMPPTSDPARISATRRKLWLKRIACFLTASILVGCFYGWSFPRAFPKNTTFGFGYGMLHGALMPLALPGLLMGQDVEIFATENSGRPYKIGYICGINVCGLAFFGPLFWRPKRKTTGQNHQER
jgi:hypothetical protein